MNNVFEIESMHTVSPAYSMCLDEGLHELNNVLCDALSERQQHVLHMRFNEGLSRRKIGERLNLSGTRVGQIEERALRILRLPKNFNRLKTISCIGQRGRYAPIPMTREQYEEHKALERQRRKRERINEFHLNRGRIRRSDPVRQQMYRDMVFFNNWQNVLRQDPLPSRGEIYEEKIMSFKPKYKSPTGRIT
jgi:hypothetical protein